jgi:ABC-type molybdate transport system ATPase subunit
VEQQRDAPLAAAGSAEHDPERDRRRSASQYAMTALALGDQQMWVNRLDGRRARRADPHSGLGRFAGAAQPQQTSIRNILPPRVVQCLETTDRLKCS